MATAATVDDFFALGLHPDTVTAAQSMVSRVAHVGAGAGVVTVDPESAPLGVYDIRVQVVTSGLPGVATVRWSLDAGVTWAGPVVAPAASVPLVLGVTGMAVVFGAGALVALDLYSFTAVRAVERHLAVANAKIRARIRRRFPAGLAAWDEGMIAAAVFDAAHSLLTMRGFDPKNGADKAVQLRAESGAKYLDDVVAGRLHPDDAEALFDAAPVAYSDARRED